MINAILINLTQYVVKAIFLKKFSGFALTYHVYFIS